MHDAFFPAIRAFCNAGMSMAARIAMMAITTSSSIRVKFFLDIIPCSPYILTAGFCAGTKTGLNTTVRGVGSSIRLNICSQSRSDSASRS